METDDPSTTPLHVHIGTHFYGSGNIGDDLMMAGFLASLDQSDRAVRLTCCTPFDRAAQERRFPQVQWLPYDRDAREASVRSCNLWLGLGDSPFQSDQGDWFVDHLTDELSLCRQYGKAMLYLGVGVMHQCDLENAKAAEVVRAAHHIWTRDDESAALLTAVMDSHRVTAGADLSHLWLPDHVYGPAEAGMVGLALNFEDPDQFEPSRIDELIGQLTIYHQVAWLVQEVRDLPGSERQMYGQLSDASRAMLTLRVPDYASALVGVLVGAWGAPEIIITSRYHAAIVGAWMGARVVCLERSEKIRALAGQLGLPSVPLSASVDEIMAAVQVAQPARRSRLEYLLALARFGCERFRAHADLAR